MSKRGKRTGSSSVNTEPAKFHKYRDLQERLLELHPELDREIFADFLDPAKNEEDAWGMVLRSALDDEAMISGLKDIISTNSRRLARLERLAKAKRQVIQETMLREMVGELRQPDFIATLKSSPAAFVIRDANLVPLAYRIPQPIQIDRLAILDALAEGKTIPGIAFEDQDGTLSIRMR